MDSAVHGGKSKGCPSWGENDLTVRFPAGAGRWMTRPRTRHIPADRVLAGRRKAAKGPPLSNHLAEWFMSSASSAVSIGIDFGTSNTVVALATDDGRVEAIRFDHGGKRHSVYVSAL
jgi:hypothetical protein